MFKQAQATLASPTRYWSWDFTRFTAGWKENGSATRATAMSATAIITDRMVNFALVCPLPQFTLPGAKEGRCSTDCVNVEFAHAPPNKRVSPVWSSTDTEK
jgi:hypothetical protein